MALDLLILPIILLSIVYFYLVRNFNHWKDKNVPFIKPIPIFGTIFDICRWNKSIGEYCKFIYDNTSSPFVGFFMLDEPCLLVNDLDTIKDIMIKDFDHFMNRTMTNNEEHDGIGSNILFIMKTPKWRDIRRRMTPAFSSGKMKLMSKLMVECAENMINYLNRTIVTNNVIEARELCAKLTTDTITSTSFGLEGDSFQNDNAPFRMIARRIYNWKMIAHAIQTTCFFVAPKIVALLRMNFIDPISTKFFREVFWKTMHEREENKRVRNDLLDILIEMRKQDKIDNIESMEGDVLVAQATQFFIAGYETTSSTMSFALFELAKNQEIQDKVREEMMRINKVYGKVTYESLQSLRYLDQVISETLRKYPIVPFLDRRCTKTYCLPGSDVILNTGDILYIPIMAIQNDEKYFPNPDLFDPDRFTEENVKNRHSMAYLPFGDGPRNCIGKRYALLNAKCGLFHLLSNFRVKSCDLTEEKIVVSQRGFLLQPENGIHLQFEKL